MTLIPLRARHGKLLRSCCLVACGVMTVGVAEAHRPTAAVETSPTEGAAADATACPPRARAAASAGTTAPGRRPGKHGLGLEVPQCAVIGSIRIRAESLFDIEDPEEDRKIYRLANRLHRTTREDVIRHQLLFGAGDDYSPDLVAESERALRRNRYLYDARVRPVAVHDGLVDVEVWTRDVWTLNAGFSFGRAGGEQSTALRLEDSNLLGTGKGLVLEHRSSVDRVSNLAAYKDPNVLGSRVRLEALLADNSDGYRHSLVLGKPFESLESRWAAGLRVSTADQIDPIYSLGHITDRFSHQSTLLELSGGVSKGSRNHRTLRWNAGLTYQRDLFRPAPDQPYPDILPDDRNLVYPWLGFELTSDRFATTRDLDNLDRTEDLYLGHRYTARVGYASSGLGSDRNAAIFGASADLGWRFSERQTLLADSHLAGRWGQGGAENLLLQSGLRYYHRDFGKQLLFVLLEGSVADNLDQERQLLLGGDNGLRGYPLRYQSGEADLLLTVEQRFFTHWYPWRLFHVGAAVFFDAGRTWGMDVAGTPNLGLLKDVGAGLRLGNSRSAGSVIHLDVAFPLDGDKSIRGVQWLVRTKRSL